VELVPEGVAVTLDREREYGIRWWNRSSQTSRQVSEPTHNGQKHYRRKVTFASRGQEEWIGAPVPAFLSRELVDSARARMTTPRPQERKNLAVGA
jgi:hypothetical protein